MGFTEGSLRTPTGKFRVSEKIGAGEPIYTKFVARVPVGAWEPSDTTEDDLILTRILRLEGLDAENANTLDRYIYIHGTNREDLIGRPASHGCVRLANSDMSELFDAVETGAEMTISPLTSSDTKLLFIDCDSTLSQIEGIDELARLSDPAIFAEVVNLTDAAMNGEIPLAEVFRRRMDIIKPDRELVERVGRQYVETIVPGVEDFLAEARTLGWLPVIISGGFAPAILPLAKFLDICHVEAVPLYFNALGEYSGYGDTYPSTRNLGKNEIIREWKQAMLPSRTIMIGDGISDLETKPDVDLMIAFGGVVAREKVMDGAGFQATRFDDITERLRELA